MTLRSPVALSSGSLATAHADYLNSWEPKTLAALEHYCFDGRRLCYKEMGVVLRKLHLKRNRFADFVSSPPPAGS